MVARYRLRQKTPAATEGRTRKPKRVASKKESNKNSSDLREAVRLGWVPKARTCYAIFVKESWPSMKNIKTIAAKWRGLSKEQQAKFVERAQKEFAVQREAARQYGLRVRMPGQLSIAKHAAVETPFLTPANEDKHVPAMPKTCRSGDYEFCGDNIIGEGAYGTVVEASNCLTGEKTALKFFGGASALESARRESKVYEALRSSHPGNRFFLQALEMQLGCRMSWIALPIIACGSLRKHLMQHGALDVVELHAAGVQLAQGLQRLHEGVGYLHLDIKPGNLLWDAFTRRLWIADFGLSELVEQSCRGQLLPEYVTENYRPPELFAQVCGVNTLLPAVDYWSYGCVIYELAFCRLMFPAPVSRSHHVWRRLFYKGLSSTTLGRWAEVVTRCLNWEPTLRRLPTDFFLLSIRPPV